MGKVLYEFKANGQYQIDLAAGERVEVLKESSGWFRGRVVGREGRGIFPVSFIQILPDEPFPERTTTTQHTANTNAASAASATANNNGAQAGTPARGAPRLSQVSGGSTTPAAAASPSSKTEAQAAATPASRTQQPVATPTRKASTAEERSLTRSPSATRRSVSGQPVRSMQSPKSSPASPPPTSHGRNDSGVLLSPTVATAHVANSSSNFHGASSRFNSPKGPVPLSRPSSLNSTLDMSAQDNTNSVESKLKADMSVESLLQEIDHTVRDWNGEMRSAVVLGNTAEYHRGMERLSALMECRRRLQTEEGEEARAAIRHEIIEMIEGSRKMAEGYMVPRNAAGKVADSNNTGVIELLNLHRSMYSALKAESSHVWMQKAQERKTKSLQKQKEMEQLNTSSSMLGAVAPSPSSPSSTSTSSSTPTNAQDRKTASAATRNSLSAASGQGEGSTAVGSNGSPISANLVSPAASGKKWPSGALQLYLNVKMCIFSVGEATDLFFSLYSVGDGRFLTEEYSLALSDQGLPINLQLLHKMRTVFADLSARDFQKDLWLVCKIFRRGKLVFDATKPKSSDKYRRPFGCAACSLTESNLDAMIGREFEPPNAAMTIYTCTDESKFSRIHEMIIAKERGLETAPRAKGIALGLVLYAGDLDSVRKSHEDTMDAATTPSTKKLSFPPLISPNDMRNDLYVHLLGGNFSQDGKKSAKNIEVGVRVVLDDGTGVERCITHGSSDMSPQTEYRSTVYYHLNTPFYAETLRINLPDGITMSRAHLLLTFWHVSTNKKIACFAFSYFPLSGEGGSIIKDGDYKLPTHKPYPKIELGPAQGPGACFYLAGDNARPKLEVRPKEFLVVRTQTLSTFQTQNLTLHTTLNHPKDDTSPAIRALLEKFISSTSQDNLGELTRFMREIMHTLFSMMVAAAASSPAATFLAGSVSNGNMDAIFRAILHVLVLLTDRKNELPTWSLVEEYIQTLFRTKSEFAKLYPILIKMSLQALNQAATLAINADATRSQGKTAPAPSSSVGADSSLLKLTKTLPYLLKVILASREVEVSSFGAEASLSDDAFKNQLLELLKAVTRLLGAPSRDELGTGAEGSISMPTGSISSPTQFILPAQSYLVRSFPESIADLLRLFGRTEMSDISKQIVQAVPRHPFGVLKLNLIRNIVTSPLGDYADSRDVLLPIIIPSLVFHMGQIEKGGLGEPYICIAILFHLLHVIGKAELGVDESSGGDAASSDTNASAHDPSRLEPFIPLLEPLVLAVLRIQQNTLGETGPGIIPLKQPSDAILETIRIDVVVDSITCLWTLLRLMSAQQVESFIAGLSDKPDADSNTEAGASMSPLQRFLSYFLQVCLNALQTRCYPDMWVVMNMVECTCITNMLTHCSKPIREKIIKDTDRNGTATELMALCNEALTSEDNPNDSSSSKSHRSVDLSILRSFFNTIMSLLMYDQLQLESFPGRKKIFVHSRYGDLRGSLMTEFKVVWNDLSNSKICYVEQFLIQKVFDLARGAANNKNKDEEDDKQDTNKSSAAASPKSSGNDEASNDEGAASRNFALEIYFDMLVTSFVLYHRTNSPDLFTQVERHTIDCLYNLANVDQDAGRKLMTLIYDTCSRRFQQPTETLPEGLAQAGMDFLRHILRMYELMSSLLCLPDTHLFEDERTGVALKLMQYLESSGHTRKDMYSKYVQYLVDLHVGLKNYAEAGCTAIQAIKMLSWSAAPLAALNSTLSKFPAEQEHQRKEQLYLAAIQYFTSGEEWERAIALCEELRAYYQYDRFDYPKLSNLLQAQSECFRNIVGQERFYPNYFRVVFYGSGFDEELTGASTGKEREFVYRGVKLEPVMDFTNERIKRKWPDAKILMSSDKPNEEMLSKHKQIISITTLQRASLKEADDLLAQLNVPRPAAVTPPMHDGTAPVTGASCISKYGFSASPATIPKNITTYREHNDLCVFVYAKGIQKALEKNPKNEFKHLWVSKTYLVTEECFPNNRRRMIVNHRKEVLLPPIVNAIATMHNKTNELREKVETVAQAPSGPVDVGPLSMNLNGMIDAAVNGGTQKYIEAFIGEDYLQDQASDQRALAKQHQEELKAAIREQVEELKVGLDVFGKRCDEKLKGLYQHLRGFYEQMVAKTQNVIA